MKIKWLIFLFFLFANAGYAQQLFYKTYAFDSLLISNRTSAIKCKNDDYLILSLGWKNAKFQISLVRTDSSGNSLWGKTYISNTSEYANGIKDLNDTTFLINGGFSVDSNLPNWNLGFIDLIKVDNNGNVLSKKALVDSTFINNLSITKISIMDSNIYGIGYARANPHYFAGINPDTLDRGFIFKADISGNVIWAKKYGPYFTRFGDFVVTPDSGFIGVGYSELYDTINKRFVITFKIDTNGNVLWAKQLELSGVLNSIIYDGSGYVIAGGFAIGASVYSIAFKIDKFANIQWAYGYGSGEIKKITKLNNGKLTYANGGFGYWVADSIGTSTFRGTTGNSINEGFTDFIPENNGGFSTVGNKSSKACFFKTDSNYNSCTLFYNSLPYTQFNLQLDSSILTTTPFTLQLINSNITQSNLNITDSVLCQTATSVLQFENSALRIYPNPANDILNIELPLDGNKKKLFEISDLTGRVLISSTENIGKTTLNVATLMDGIYFLKFIFLNRLYVKTFIKTKT